MTKTTTTNPKPPVISAIRADVPVPARKRGHGRDPVYPFDQLDVGQSFHATHPDLKPDELLKRMQSSISAARARYSEVVPGQTRKNNKGETIAARKATRNFRAVTVDKTDAEGPGVRVFRVALDD